MGAGDDWGGGPNLPDRFVFAFWGVVIVGLIVLHFVR